MARSVSDVAIMPGGPSASPDNDPATHLHTAADHYIVPEEMV
jgi:hypothetical protein